MMRKERKSVLRYFGRVTRDLYAIMPWEVSGIILLELLEAAAGFLQVSAAAGFFDAAGRWLEGGADRNLVFRRAGLFVVAMGLPMLCRLLVEALQNLPMFLKHHRLIHRLHGRVASVPLIRLEEPEFHNEVWRAKMSVYNFGLVNYFFGFIDLLPLLVRLLGTVWVIAAFHISFIPLALLSVLPSILVRFRYQRERYSMKRAQTPLERRKDYLWQVLTGRSLAKELRTMGTEKYIREKWALARDQVMDETLAFERKNGNRVLRGDLFKFFGVGASIGLSIWFAHRGLISLGQFAACIAAFGSLQSMAESVMNQLAWQKGRVLYDGKDAFCYDKDSFYKSFSVIQQNFVKYQFTVRENIGISRPAQIHNDERLLKSARDAGIEGTVRRAGGLDAQLGREFDGVELSGGEWQKLAIARGLNKDADVIILDEPTSALDPLVEYDILVKFLDMTRGKTSVIISHRIGLGRFADRIIVMKDGRVAQTGTHDELLAMGGEYGRMWHEQAKWYQ